MKLKVVFFVLGMLCSVTSSEAQKPILDPLKYKDYDNWSELGPYNSSKNGKYIWYNLKTGSPHLGQTKYELVLVAPGSPYEKRFKEAVNAEFSSNGEFLIFRSGKDIGCFQIGKDKLDYLESNKGYKVVGNQVVYGKDSTIYVKNLINGKIISCPGDKFLLNEQASAVAIQGRQSLSLLNLVNGQQKVIFHGGDIASVTSDAKGNNIAFIAGNAANLVLYNYSKGKKGLEMLITQNAVAKDFNSDLLSEGISFSQNGKTLFFSMAERKERIDKSEFLRIWSYLDIYYEPRLNRRASISLETKNIVQLENANARMLGTPHDDCAILSSVVRDTEIIQDSTQYPLYELVSLKNGSRQKLPVDGGRILLPEFSPSGKFISWFDYYSKDLMVLDISSGRQKNVTKGMDVEKLVHIDGISDHFFRLNVFKRYWTAGEGNIFLEDSKDIWSVDPLGAKAPRNLTESYRGKDGMRFKFAEDRTRIEKINKGEQMLIAGFADQTHFNGLYKMEVESSVTIKELIKPGPYVYFFPGSSVFDAPLPTHIPIGNKYLVRKESSNSSTNLELLEMNGKLTKVTNIHPEKNYNWLTTELHHFKASNGEDRKGILYKPENFDPAKKYPVILYYYEMLSTECFKFKSPGYSAGPLNIPSYVSNGYLVFVPDIWQKKGAIGESALVSVEGAANYLKNNFSWVDGDHMGLQGHSFGGYYTNYLAVNSKMFAAAQSSAGIADLFREYGDIGFGGTTLTFMAERGQINMGDHPWNIHEKYFKNSPFYSADRCTTPLLMQHGEIDHAVNFGQSRSLFIALRRLHKPAWLLEYKSQDHGLGTLESMIDFTERQMEFFDHYLKGKPIPDWMKEGVSRL